MILVPASTGGGGGGGGGVFCPWDCAMNLSEINFDVL